MKKMDWKFWCFTMGPAIVGVLGSIVACLSAYHSKIDADREKVKAEQEKHKADSIAEENTKLLKENYKKSLHIIDDLELSAVKTKSLMDNTNVVLETTKHTLQTAGSSLKELIETRNRLGGGPNKPFINVQCLPQDGDKTFFNFVCVNSSERYPLNHVTVSGLNWTSMINPPFNFDDPQKRLDDLEKNGRIKTKSMDLAPDEGTIVYQSTVDKNVNKFRISFTIKWSSGNYEILFDLDRQEGSQMFRITNALIDGKPAPNSLYHEEGFDIPFTRY